MDNLDKEFNKENNAFGLTELPNKVVYNSNHNKEDKSENNITIEDEINSLKINHQQEASYLSNEQLLSIKKEEYENLSQDQLIRLSKLKNEKLLQSNQENENLKTKLNQIIKSLNKVISENTDKFTSSTNEDSENIINKLESLHDVRKKDLQMSKRSNITIKKLYKAISKQYGPSSDIDKINELSGIQVAIEDMKEGNCNIKKKILELKKVKVKQARAFEILKITKSKKALNASTTEVNNLSVFKHDYYKKILSAKKSLLSEKSEFKRLQEMMKTIDENKLKKDKKDKSQLLQKVKEWIRIIEKEFQDTEQEIFIRIEEDKSEIMNKLIEDINVRTARARSQSPQSNDMERALINSNNNNFSYTKNFRSLNCSSVQNIFNINTYKLSGKNVKIGKRNILFPKKISTENSMKKMILNKTREKFNEYENKKGNSKGKEIDKSKMENNSKEEDKDKDNLIYSDELYNKMTDEEYRELIKKKDEYLNKKAIIEENANEILKTSDNKVISIRKRVNHNLLELNKLIETNKTLKQEIEELVKLKSISIEKANKKMLRKNASQVSTVPLKIIDFSPEKTDLLTKRKISKENKAATQNIGSSSERKDEAPNIQKIPKKKKVLNTKEKLLAIRNKYINFKDNDKEDLDMVNKDE